MFNWLFKKEDKQDLTEHKQVVQTALNKVKQDMDHVGKWLKHLNETDSDLKKDVEDIKDDLRSIKNDMEELKEIIKQPQEKIYTPIFKQPQTAAPKQTTDYGVQTAVQSTVQAAFFERLSISEKALIGILLSSDMKLSYEDLAVMTGKDPTTVRGQVNTIKQKAEGLIEEQVEKNGKKRLYVPEKIKGILLKKVKTKKNREKTIEIE
jgi:ABC-type transporter Mla subunit MlaD